MSDIITFEDLQKATGYQQPADVAAHLNREGVEYFLGKHNRPYTLTSMYLVAKGILPNPINETQNPALHIEV